MLPAGRLVVGAWLALFPLVGYSLGLGKLKVNSALNEPLNAEIEFTSITEKELKGLNVTLAPRKDFESAGIERLPFLSQIKFTVAKKLDGRFFLQLHTDQQIEEPFLHILLHLEWSGGRLVREYTALIDPPYQIAGRPAGIEVPQTEAEAVPEAEMEPLPPPVAEEPKPEVAKEEIKPEPEEKAAEAKVAEADKPAPEPKTAEAPSAPPPVEPLAADEKLLGPEIVKPSEAVASTDLSEEDAAAPKVEALEPAAAAEAPKPEADMTAAAPAWANVPEYHVKRGDTLWAIANQVRSDKQHTTEQVILALFKANPNAFFGNNVNNLKAGKILKMPENESVAALPPAQARTQFRAQYDVWQEYKLKLASSSRAIKVAEAVPEAPKEPVKKDAAKPEPSKAAKAPAAPVEKTGQPEDLLKIVRSTLQDEKATGEKKVAEAESRKDVAAKERQALAERVTTLDESLASKQMEHKELSEKIGQVREQLKKEARLIELESKELAQAQLKAKPPVPEAKPAEPAPAPKPEAVKPAEKPVVAEAPKPEAPKPAAEPVTPVRTEKPPVKKPVAPPPPAAEKDLVAELKEYLGGDLLLPGVAGAVVLVSGVIALVYLRRRKKSIAEFEESILSSDAISTGEAAVTTDTSGQVVSAGDTSFLSDFSQGGMGNVRTDEVDPVAEAEVYLAYGRDETAEEILKEAIVKNPERQELKVKLLEIYSGRNDVRAFETLAEEMYAALGGRGGKVWAKVEEMGRKLNPENPMFRGGPAAKRETVTTTGGKAPTAKLVETQTNLQPPPPPPPAATAQTAPAADFDFDIGTAAAPTAGATAFDLDLGEPKGEAAAGLEALDLGQSAGHVVDFDAGKKESGNGAEEIVAPAVAEEGQVTQQWDETATKLDLAKAYIDMGDAEGARSILAEVMAEGNAAQKKQAQELSIQIA
jgi:pilus assembly protein FimV